MTLNANALIDTDYWNTMWSGEAIDADKLDELINAASTAFEIFCNRNLKARTYTYNVPGIGEDVVQDLDYTIFDGPPRNAFLFPTYPVNYITSLIISDVTVSESSTYYADTGYVLYKKSGKLIYDLGFDYGYYKNVKVIWNGGYLESHIEMSLLKYLLFSAVKDYVNAPDNQTMLSEKIGDYQYTAYSPTLLNQMYGLSPQVFNELSKFRREAIG